MEEQFYTILTAVGKAKIANAAALGKKIELTELALGDGGGSYYNPTEDQTELRNEVWRGAIGTVDVDGENPNWITIQTVVPSQHGGFMIREAGVFDNEGDLIAVGKYPETYKPVAADGSIKDLIVRMILEVSNAASVVLKVDPTVVLATQQQVNEAEARAKAYADQEVAEVSQALDAHKAAAAPHSGHETPAGAQAKAEAAAGAVQAELDAHKADYTQLFPDNAGAHNGIYRGKHLGNSVTSEQYAAISAGTFEDMYIGDYWTIGGANYRIAAFNYYYNVGDTATTVNHVTLVPDTILYTHVMNETDTTEGGYTGSKMYTEGLDQAKSTIKSAFSGHVLKHRKLLSNVTTDGKASGWAWVDSEVDLMTEIMVYGSIVWGESTVGCSGYNIGEGKSRLPLFMLRPDSTNITRSSWWLRDVVSASTFANVRSYGHATHFSASYDIGVRPAFSIS